MMHTPEDKFIKIDDLNLHYLDWGYHDMPSMVLLHGLCSSAHYWDFFSRSASGEYHVMALDQRGHGDSDRAESYGPKGYVLDLEGFVEKLGLEKLTLIGHSMGGINAIIYAAKHPENVQALVIVDIGPEISPAGVERMEAARTTEPETFDTEDEVISYIKKIEPRQSDDFTRHQGKYAVKPNAQDLLTFKYDPALLGTELRSPEWLWDYTDQVICPALLLHGSESDMLDNDIAMKMVKKLMFGRLVDIQRAGHGIPGDNPEDFETVVLKFLRDNVTE
jgi:pimeloyl-ACP methyl ester carboxylesterase